MIEEGVHEPPENNPTCRHCGSGNLTVYRRHGRYRCRSCLRAGRLSAAQDPEYICDLCCQPAPYARFLLVENEEGTLIHLRFCSAQCLEGWAREA